MAPPIAASSCATQALVPAGLGSRAARRPRSRPPAVAPRRCRFAAPCSPQPPAHRPPGRSRWHRRGRRPGRRVRRPKARSAPISAARRALLLRLIRGDLRCPRRFRVGPDVRLGRRGRRDGKQVPGLLVRGDGVGPPSRHAEPVAVRLDLCIVGRSEDLQDRYRLTRRGTRRLRDSAPGRQDQKSRACSSDAKSRHCVLRCAMIRIGTGRRDATLTQMGIFRASADEKAAQLSASCRGSSRRPRSLGSSAVVFAAVAAARLT